MAKYLDSAGLGHYDTKIKGYIDNKVDEEVKIKTIKLNGTEVAPASKVVNLVINAATASADPAGKAAELMSTHEADETAHSAIFAKYVPKSNLGTEAGNVPVLGSDGKLDTSVLPSLAIMDVYTVASQTAMLALKCQKGDIAVRTDVNKTFILTADDPSKLASWTELRSPDCKVTSVAGKTGAVTLVKGDVGLGNVDNTSDVDKPISTATQTALNGKVPTTRKVNGHALSADVTVTKGDVGLGNVDNTSDKNKPVSTATQTALDAKQDKVDNDLDYTPVGTGAQKTVVGAINVALLQARSAMATAEGIENGDSLAKLAQCDEDGNRIIDTYATKAALDGKVPTTRKVNGHALSADVTVTKGDVGLGNVDNTSDKNKPISTATQTALDNKLGKTDSRISVGDTTLNGDVVMAINHVYSIADTAKTTAETANLNVNSVIGGTKAAGKATADGDGNVIKTTYATIAAVANKQDKMTAITDTEIDALFTS